MLALMHQYIGGQRRDAASGETFDVVDPSTNETIETVTLAGHDDVDAAVAAASAAFDGVEPRHPGRALDGAAQGRPAARRARRGARPAREPTGRQADPAGPRVRRAGHRRQHRVLRHRRPPPRRHGQRRVLRRPHLARSGASRSASSARSPRGTTRCRWPPGRSCPPSPPATPSCSSPPRSPRSPACSSPRRSPRPAPPPVSSTWSPAPARSPASTSSATPTSR